MGLQREVRFPSGTIPTWESFAKQLVDSGESLTIRMIDGLPAFPDELPGDKWSEVRVSFPAGMITMRAVGNSVNCVVWGNSDHQLIRSWNKICWCWCAAGEGVVLEAGETLSLEEFAKLKGINPA